MTDVLEAIIKQLQKEKKWGFIKGKNNEKKSVKKYESNLTPTKIKSDSHQILYETIISENDYFVGDHVVNKKPLVPASVYLELARYTINEALKNGKGQQLTLTNVSWPTALYINNDEKKIFIEIESQNIDNAKFQIFSKNANNETVIHCRGEAVYCKHKKIKKELNKILDELSESENNADQIYNQYRTIGINYGETFQTIDKIKYDGKNIIAQLRLPSALMSSIGKNVLLPSMVDGSIHAALGFKIYGTEAEINEKSLVVLFAIEKIRIFTSCVSDMVSIVSPCKIMQDDIVNEKYNVDLCDIDGNVCISIRGASFRKINKPCGANEIINNIVCCFDEKYKTTAKQSGNRVEMSIKNEQIPKLQKLNEIIVKKLYGVLNQIGIVQGGTYLNNSHSNNIVKSYKKWVDESKQLLINYKLINENKENNDSDLIEIGNEQWKEFCDKWKNDAMLGVPIKLISMTLSELPMLLQGKVKATDIIFPSGKMELVEGFYKNNEISDYYNEIVAEIVGTYLKESNRVDNENKVRLFEIGAGTGGVSSRILEVIKPYRNIVKDYYYTDVSKSFLTFAEEKYKKDNDFIRFELFDVEKKPEVQKISTDQYDIVIANNVLHATNNIVETIKNVKSLLTLNGILIINELIEKSALLHLTFGLLDGWWKYDDDEYRIPGSPLVSIVNWKQLLEKEGFRLIELPIMQNHGFGQQVIIAQNITKYKSKSNLESMERKSNELGKDEQEKEMDSAIINTCELINKEKIGEYLIVIIADALKMSPHKIDKKVAFSDYGVDSIVGVKLIDSLNMELGIDLETTDIFEYTTVEKMTEYIMTKTINNPKYHIKDKINRFIKDESAVGQIPESIDVMSVHECEQNEKNNQNDEKVAIIGISCRFPESENPDEFWKHLKDGDDLVKPISRWDLTKIYRAEQAYCNFGGFLNEIDKFDSLFFNISGYEAEFMDPQQRIFLEECWKSLEDAGYALLKDGLKCGVYVGANPSDYYELMDSSDPRPAQSFWGNSSSIIPSRISYFMNYNGPTIAIDTACSSSLVAIHIACQSLINKEIDMALAGGVFLRCTPEFQIFSENASMMSAGGKCFAFDERADGIVYGEGAGVIVLKRLSDAQKDNDHIYGIIKGSGINNDGATNGITAPSQESQEMLEISVYEKNRINPEDIQMMEAHGTGTKLGDPIEFKAISKAFMKYTNKKKYCAIGSVKTNIGHAATASGMAGLLKVILAIKNKKIPKSLHFRNGNTRINFNDSPFYVNTSLLDWNVDLYIKRCAAVSSFGLSGTNAHIVVEEYAENNEHCGKKAAYLIVLSSMSTDQLKLQADLLINKCVENIELNCNDISYTLLIGRRRCSCRIAFVAKDIDDIVDKLRKWISGDNKEDVYTSLPDQEITIEKQLINYGNECIDKLKDVDDSEKKYEILSLLANLFVQGYDLNYEKIFKGDQAGRISLPTYPFKKKSYWIKKVKKENKFNDEKGGQIHPLLHINTSTLKCVKFTSHFKGDEKYLTDHIVDGKKTFPGAAYIEMARAAFSSSIEGVTVDDNKIVFKNITWVNPLVVDNKITDADIFIRMNSKNEIVFKVENKNESETTRLKCQGIIKVSKELTSFNYNIESFTKKCNIKKIDANECYKRYSNMGIEYGLAHRGVNAIYIGEEVSIAEIKMPKNVEETHLDYILHPSLIDSVFQATFMAIIDNNETEKNEPNQMYMPFELQELEILNRLPFEIWAIIKNKHTNAGNSKIIKCDVDVCDIMGNVLVRIKGMSARKCLKEGICGKTDKINNDYLFEEYASLTLPAWNEIVLSSRTNETVDLNTLIICNDDEKYNKLKISYQKNTLYKMSYNENINEIIDQLTAYSNYEHVLWIAPDTIEDLLSHSLTYTKSMEYVVSFYRLIKSLLALGYGVKKITITIVTTYAQFVLNDDNVNPYQAGLHGFIGSVAKEYPVWKIRLLDIERNDFPVDVICSMPDNLKGDAIVKRKNKYYKQELIPYKQHGMNRNVLKKDGKYIIIGGAGGIGVVVSEYLIKEYNAQIIWIGRKEKNTEITNNMERLSKYGPKPMYFSTDCSKYERFQKKYDEIKSQYPIINGVINSALDLNDQSIARLTEINLIESVASKIDISINITRIFKNDDLDFILLFSSIQSYVKAPGQSGYATGCNFMDAYTHMLAKNKQFKVKVINWSYWGSVGAVSTKEHREKMVSYGLGSIEPHEGMMAVENLLNGPKNQLAYIKLIKTTN